MPYSIVIWVYNKLKGSDWSSKDTVQTKLEREFAKDKHGRGQGWMDNSDWFNDVFEAKERYEQGLSGGKEPLSQGVTEYNEPIIRKQIKDAETVNQLDNISLDEIYINSVKADLNKLIENRRNEFVREKDRRNTSEYKEFKSKVKSSKDPDYIGSISFGEVEEDYGKEARKEISDLVYERQEDIETITKRYQRDVEREINSASLDELPGLRSKAREAYTTSSEDELLSLIAQRERELS